MSIAERKQREKDARLAHIKNTAANLFESKGYEGTTMGEIAELCDLSKSSIYAHFKSKDDLFYSIVEPALAEITKRLGEISSNKEESPIKAIKSLVDVLYDDYANNPVVYQMLIQKNMNTLSAQRANHLEEMIRANAGSMAKVIQNGIEQGVFEQVDPKLTAIIITNCFIGICLSQTRRTERARSDYRKSTLDEALKVILRGIKKTDI